MQLTLRAQKGEKLTVQELDNNFLFLNGSYLDVGSSSVTTTIDWSVADIQQITLDDSPTLSFTNSSTGQIMTLILKQSKVGTKQVTWPRNLYWSGSEIPIIPTCTNTDPDVSFYTHDGFDSTVNSVVIQDDGKILVGGSFTSYQSNKAPYLIRLNENGTVDDTFIIGDGFDNGVNVIKLQSDGKILIGGEFTKFDNQSSQYIARLNSNGTIDNTFFVGEGFDNSVRDLLVLNNGKIIVGGIFNFYDGNERKVLVRLNSNGTYDATFESGSGFDPEVKSVVLTLNSQDDGKILVGGSFTTYNEDSYNGLIRLNSDGSLDNTFSIGTGFIFSDAFVTGDGYINNLLIQPDSKILVVGYFTKYDENDVSYIVRLNPDGSIDNSFTQGSGFDNNPTKILSFNTDFFICAGYFTIYDSGPAAYVCKINYDGTLDTKFNPKGLLDGGIESIALQTDSKIILGGNFYTNGSLTTPSLTRVIGDLTTNYFQINLDYDGENYIGTY